MPVAMTDALPTTRINPPERCEECGWQAASVTPDNAESAVRDLGRRYRAPLTRFLPTDPDDLVRRRPSATTWSALEYAAHVRDVIALWGGTLHKLLSEDRPVVPRPDPSLADDYAAIGDYNALDPAVTADELAANAERMARKIATIGTDQWDRVIVLGDEEMTALAVARKVAHEGAHHLLDVGRSLRAARGS
jgi:DinB family protein